MLGELLLLFSGQRLVHSVHSGSTYSPREKRLVWIAPRALLLMPSGLLCAARVQQALIRSAELQLARFALPVPTRLLREQFHHRLARTAQRELLPSKQA